MNAKLFIDETIIGTVNLKITDEFMGVLTGYLTPNENYHNYKEIILNQFDKVGISNKEHFNYKLILENGFILNPEGGIGVSHSRNFIDEIFVETAGNDIEKIKINFEM